MLRLQRPEYAEGSYSDLELERFFQSWLYFGFLHLFFAPAGLYDATDFIGQDEGGKFVHTKMLIEKLQSWEEIVMTWQDAVQQRIFDKIDGGINIARDAIGTASNTIGDRFDPAIMQSIAALFETTASVFRRALKGDRLNVLIWGSLSNLKITAAEFETMTRNGWCPYDIRLAGHDFPSESGRYYVRRLAKGDARVHDNCDSSVCQSTQINLRTYLPRHVQASCGCNMAGGDVQEISGCLQNDTFPVFRISQTAPGGPIVINIKPYEEGVAFVALSHVWADGLGNPAAAKLPSCQLLRLQRLVDDITGETYTWREGKGQSMIWKERSELKQLYIWCDTICCPPAPPGCTTQEEIGKQKAIGKIMDVYRKAAYVIMLDRSMEDISIEEVGPLEVAVRIFTSPWIRRLWTFQEAALAQKVLVKCRERRLVDFSHIWAKAQEIGQSGDLQLRALAHAVASHFGRLRNYFDLAEDPEPDRRAVVRAMAYRKVSVSSDEPLCLGAVFGLDNRKLAETAANQRMAEMWRLMATTTQRGVPDSVVFNFQPRLNTPGFRWAPATILLDDIDGDSSSTGGTVFLSNKDELTPGVLTRYGLRVSRPGWRIRNGKPPSGTPPSFFPAPTESPPPIFFFREDNGRWLMVISKGANLTTMNEGNVVSPGQLIEDADRDWILLQDETGPHLDVRVARANSRGIIGYITEPSPGTQVFRTALSVSISRPNTSNEIIFEASYKAAEAVLGCWSIFWLRILSRGLDGILKMASWLPRSLREFFVRVLDRVRTYLTTKLINRITQDISMACRKHLSTPRVREAMLLNGMTVDTGFSVGLAPTMLMGRFVRAIDEFPASHEWVVD